MLGVALLLCFASWLTVHFAITVALSNQNPRWRAAVCLLPPLNPAAAYWALRQGMYTRAALWGFSCLGYLVLLYATYR